MKKLMIIILLSCLVFGLTAVAWAAESSTATTVYLDAFTGKYNSNEDQDYFSSPDTYIKREANLSGVILGLESQMNNQFQLALEYGQVNTNDLEKTIKGGSNTKIGKCDYTLSEIKGGYRVIDLNSFKLDVIMSALNIDMKKPTDGFGPVSNLSGNMFGADLVCNFSDKVSIQGTIASSLLGSYIYNGNYTDDLTAKEYKLKFNYFITDNWALTLGYRDYQFSGKFSDNVYKDKLDINLSGATIGVKYKF